MAEDPRLDLVSAAGGSPEARQTGQMADLARRLDALEHGGLAGAGSAARSDTINLATGVTQDIGPQVQIRIPANGLLLMTMLAGMQAGGGPLYCSLLEDGNNTGVFLVTNAGPVTMMAVPSSTTGVAITALGGVPGGGIVAIPNRTPGLHTYSLQGNQGGPGPGTGTFTTRSLWVWTLV